MVEVLQSPLPPLGTRYLSPSGGSLLAGFGGGVCLASREDCTTLGWLFLCCGTKLNSCAIHPGVIHDRNHTRCMLTSDSPQAVVFVVVVVAILATLWEFLLLNHPHLQRCANWIHWSNTFRSSFWPSYELSQDNRRLLRFFLLIQNTAYLIILSSRRTYQNRCTHCTSRVLKNVQPKYISRSNTFE